MHEPTHAMTWPLIPSLALLLIAIWIVLPPFHAGLLPLAVGAPEVSPWLLLASLGLCAATFTAAATAPAARAALVCAAAAAALSAYPLARSPSTLSAFDGAMQEGLGRTYVEQIPAAIRATLRPHALSPVDFVRGIARDDVLVRRGVEFAKPGGVPLTVDIYRPPSAGPHPVLVQLYGGSWQRGAPADNASFATWFASQGYLVVAADYRHAPEATWPAQSEDVRAALGWVRAHAAEYEADPSRMALLGRSAGAQLALVAAYEAPLVRAVVSYYGPTDLVEGWRQPPRPDPLDIRSILETYLRGTPDSAGVRYREASPVTYTASRGSGRAAVGESALPPTLLVYGARDHIVSPGFGRELDGRLRAAGARSVLLEIPWAEHAFDAVPNGVSGQIALYYTQRFLAWALR